VRQWGDADLRFADLQRDHGLALRARELAREMDRCGELDAVRESLLDVYAVGDRLAVG
jgi:hypothetical protein